jgi:signal transduction histidine kinase
MTEPASLDATFPPGSSAARRAQAHERRRAAMDNRKRSFLRMVSHELRTPLNAVIGFSEILSQELYGPLGAPQYREYAGIVHDSGLKLLKLVNQIVELARLEGQVTDLDLRPEPLDEAIAEALEPLKPEMTARGISARVADLGVLPCVMADRRGLRTMLANLLQNAVTHSPDGGQVFIAVQPTAGGAIEILIVDQGPGVAQNELGRLLRPFEQGGDVLNRSGQGVGLGLPIVDLLARAMNGALKLSSRPGAGLAAHLSLPRA